MKFYLLAISVLFGASIFADTLKSEISTFRACEWLRAESPETRIAGVKELFEKENWSLQNLTMLKYLWVAETDPKVRKEIITGFINIGDHRYISDPDFPEFWIEALNMMNKEEQEIRRLELQRLTTQSIHDTKGFSKSGDENSE